MISFFRSRVRAAAVLFLFGSPAAAQTEMKMAPNPLGITMNRGGSGTTWTPDAVTLPSVHVMRGNWEYMVHGFVFGQYIDQGGRRGDTQLGSINWGMLMATHGLAGGRLSFRAMVSLDPATVSARGYPLLLQTGETYQGAPLVDRQHPHDFWKELAMSYEREISSNLGFSLYGGPSGEPALSPVAFMHRQSAMDNPLAPLGHHWQDASHISFGVVTAGLFGRKWKLEGSVFNGREPDESRWDFDLDPLDSYSGRLTVNPNANWSATLAYGYLTDVERSSPPEVTNRIVGSLLHGATLGAEGQVATSLVVGANSHDDFTTGMSLLESEAILDSRNTVFGRLEVGRKGSGDLMTPTSVPRATHSIAALSAGYVREFIRVRRATIGLGAMGTINHLPDDALAASYGSSDPKALTVFLRLRPTLLRPATGGHAHH
jgi:hypothetical protein